MRWTKNLPPVKRRVSLRQDNKQLENGLLQRKGQNALGDRGVQVFRYCRDGCANATIKEIDRGFWRQRPQRELMGKVDCGWEQISFSGRKMVCHQGLDWRKTTLGRTVTLHD